MANSRMFQWDRRNISVNAWRDINQLHESYFLSDLPKSSATSSHWAKYSSYQIVVISSDQILANGVGFGDYENNENLSFFRRLINIPMALASQIALVKAPLGHRDAVKSIAKSTCRQINPDFVRLSKSLQMISSVVPDIENRKRVAIIGDGFGTLGSLFATLYPNMTIIQINLGRQLLFDYLFMVSSHPTKNHRLLESLNEIVEGEINYLPAEIISCLDAKIDVFVSSESFQEMNMKTIRAYFELMRFQSAPTFLYCANRVSKELPDGEIVELEKYGYSINDVHLSINSHWWLNWGIKRRPPYIFKMDGDIEERITVISRD